MKTILCLLAIAAAPFVSAQNAEGDEDRFTDTTNPHKAFWHASMPGGTYLVALNKIVSVSKHEYLLDGNLIITEVVIDTIGDSTVRIYQITPAAQYSNLQGAKQVVERGKDLLDRAGQRTGTDPNHMVHKTYPVTTHAKLIEFRIDDLEVLGALHGSVQSAWISGKGRRFVAR